MKPVVNGCKFWQPIFILFLCKYLHMTLTLIRQIWIFPDDIPWNMNIYKIKIWIPVVNCCKHRQLVFILFLYWYIQNKIWIPVVNCYKHWQLVFIYFFMNIYRIKYEYQLTTSIHIISSWIFKDKIWIFILFLYEYFIVY